MQKLTPVLFVEQIEPVLPFWVDRLGFTVAAEVPHDGHLGFVILQHGPVEVMYQTQASVAADIEPLADFPLNATALFIHVDNLDAVAAALEGIEPVVPRRMTFYGADELIVRDPAGNVVTFAQMKGTPEE